MKFRQIRLIELNLKAHNYSKTTVVNKPTTATRSSTRGSLVDHGANGGFAGLDVRILFIHMLIHVLLMSRKILIEIWLLEQWTMTMQGYLCRFEIGY